MHQKLKRIQLHYKGFSKTPSLWKFDTVKGIQQFRMNQQIQSFDRDINTKLRLGKYVERFVAYQYEQDADIEIIDQNIQIQEDKRTLGEIDFLIRKNEQVIHVETVYKFYLYHHSSIEELHCWVGPNRKDSLIEKLDKLQDKQLPIIHTSPCQEYLQSLHISSHDIIQQVYFKAQLFVPYASDVIFEQLNKECVVGFYLREKELSNFKDSKFYIPSKKDWLIVPHARVNWQSFEDFKKAAQESLQREFSPMCWMKLNNGTIQKFFLIWW